MFASVKQAIGSFRRHHGARHPGDASSHWKRLDLLMYFSEIFGSGCLTHRKMRLAAASASAGKALSHHRLLYSPTHTSRRGKRIAAPSIERFPRGEASGQSAKKTVCLAEWKLFVFETLITLPQRKISAGRDELRDRAVTVVQAPEGMRNALNAAGTRQRISSILRSFLKPYGFTAHAAAFLPDQAIRAAATTPAEPFLLLDWPIEWLELYASRGFAADDITLKRAAETEEPFTWTELRSENPKASAGIFALAKEFGWSDGFVIPIHARNGPAGKTFGVINLAASTIRDFDARSRSIVTATALEAFYAAHKLKPASIGRSEANTALTNRETEALSLVACGMSDDDVGVAMGITRRTAHHHVESAKRKLKAVSRAQAVAVALSSEIIRIPTDAGER